MRKVAAHLSPDCKAQEAGQSPQNHVDDAADAKEDLHPCRQQAQHNAKTKVMVLTLFA